MPMPRTNWYVLLAASAYARPRTYHLWHDWHLTPLSSGSRNASYRSRTSILPAARRMLQRHKSWSLPPQVHTLIILAIQTPLSKQKGMRPPRYVLTPKIGYQLKATAAGRTYHPKPTRSSSHNNFSINNPPQSKLIPYFASFRTYPIFRNDSDPSFRHRLELWTVFSRWTV